MKYALGLGENQDYQVISHTELRIEMRSQAYCCHSVIPPPGDDHPKAAPAGAQKRSGEPFPGRWFVPTGEGSPLLFGDEFAARRYRWKVVRRVVDQDSPGARMAAAGFSFHSVEPRSGLGRLCQGSMQTNRGSPPGALHSRV